MTATAYSRGNPIRRNTEKERWEWEDGTPIEPSIGGDVSRPCTRCGLYPTPEGDDACIGHVEGVSGACCGHGQREPYVRFDLEFEGETDFELFQQAKKLAEHTGLDLSTYIKLAIGGHNEKIKYDLSR